MTYPDIATPLAICDLPDRFVIYDLEYTAWSGSHARGWSRAAEHREVIQIGILRAGFNQGFRTGIAQSILVRPRQNPVLSGYISDLTGITQDMIDTHGVDIAEAMRRFNAICGDWPAYSFGRDDLVLEESRALAPDCPGPHAGGFGDLRPIFAAAGVDLTDMCSGMLAAHLGRPLQGSPHNAAFDVRSIAVALDELFRRGRLLR